MPDPYPAGLDPAHVLAVCSYATGGRPGLAVGAPDAICVCLPSRRLSRQAITTLARVGYDAGESPGTMGRDVLVAGWDPARLEGRLAAMRAVIHRLADDPGLAAHAALGHHLPRPGELAPADAARTALERAQADLRAWVFARSGVHAPHNPAIMPADTGTALRLRAARRLEPVIEDLMDRQVRVAEQATTLFSSLRPQLDAGRARDLAIRRASIFFHLSGSVVQDSSPLIRSADSRSPSVVQHLPARRSGRAR